ncbi:hypothetical protein SAMN05192534_12336 [Alteribacillus persepolensis]|uniref:Uncharacterized protein n=1 Tax=Alteribacillus persepolensis TaxID=568899 RepID=A0A1G8I8D2_9BACI|nr:hypothetical protein [Alteribacillus persepolensis]SDI15107.1 hypothetical protein SAMN05192534_12336 [Alteribacillus persepolensis]
MDIRDIGRAAKMNAIIYLAKRLDKKQPAVMDMSEVELNRYLAAYEQELKG